MNDKAERFIQLNTKTYSNETRVTIGRHNHWEKQPWLTPEQALAAVEIAREEVIDEVCAYLRDHIDQQLTIYHEQTWCKRDEFINRLKKAIKE